MNIEVIPCLNDNYSYLIHDEHSDIVAIVDPSEFEPCDKIIEKKFKKLDFILNTHHHYDHVGGNEKLKKKYNSIILGFENDKNRIPGVDKILKDNQEFKIGNLNFKTIFIPGHTTGHIAFYFKKEKVVFTGDTLLINGSGRTDFQGGSAMEQYDSIFNKLLKLPDKTLVYPAHDYNGKKFSTVENERNNNPRIQVGSQDEYIQIMNNLKLANPKMMDIAVPANKKGLTSKEISSNI